jgi:hypothetical protein
VLSALVAVLSGCGGGDNGSSSNPSSANYNPAETTLKDAGLQVCSQAQGQPATGLDRGTVTAVRTYFVAKDCMGKKVSPDQLTLYQFNSRQSLDAGIPKVKAANPNSQTTVYGPVLIVLTGPHSATYMAAVKKALPSSQ